MHCGSDLSAVILKRPQDALLNPTLKPKKYKLQINIGILKPQSISEKGTKSYERDNDTLAEDESIIKKRKLSDNEFKTIQSETSNSQKIVFGSYSRIPVDTKKQNQKHYVDDTMLVTAFAKGIFRFASHEVSKEKALIGSEQTQRFKDFAMRHFGKVNDTNSIKWIWTVDENDDEDAVQCKKMFLEYSLRFFSDENIILDWIEIPEIQNIVRKVYAENKAIFRKCFLDPLLGYTDINKV